MEFNENLYNAAVVGENPEAAFIVEGKRLHAVEEEIANLKKEKSDPKLIVPLMRDAWKALLKFAEGKVPSHLIENVVSLKPKEQDQLVEKIKNLYFHLPHHARNELSSLIHHKQTTGKKS
jgi:hypothetical protein